MKLSLVIPAYNEEKRILKTLRDYYSFLKKKLNNNFEILIITNNCSDKTEQVVHDFWKSINKPKNFSLHNIKGYCGKGAAVMRGFDIVKGDLIGFIDADNSITPLQFWKLYTNLKGADGIISSRKAKGSVIYPKRGFKETISSSLFTGITKLLFRFKYKDTQCGAKLFKKDVAKYLVKNYTEPGWIFDIDLLWLCKQKRFKIKEQSILWTDCEGGSVTVWNGIESVFKLINYRAKKVHDIFRFLFVGGIATLIDILMFNFFLFTSTFFIFSRFMGIFISMLWNFIMNKKFTFNSKAKAPLEALKWLVVYGIAMGCNVILSSLTYKTMGPGTYNANIAAILGLIVSIPIAYLGLKYWVFKK